jgi:putative transposase
MPNYRRNYVPGGTYFFTLVTQDRQPILTSEVARRFLRHAIRAIRRKRPFTFLAIVVLPDHLHAVWTLPRGDSDYSLRWAQIK